MPRLSGVISFESVEIAGKSLGLMRELLPHEARMVALVNPNFAFSGAVIEELRNLNLKIVTNSRDRPTRFLAKPLGEHHLNKHRYGSLICSGSPFRALS